MSFSRLAAKKKTNKKLKEIIIKVELVMQYVYSVSKIFAQIITYEYQKT